MSSKSKTRSYFRKWSLQQFLTYSYASIHIVSIYIILFSYHSTSNWSITVVSKLTLIRFHTILQTQYNRLLYESKLKIDWRLFPTETPQSYLHRSNNYNKILSVESGIPFRDFVPGTGVSIQKYAHQRRSTFFYL